MSRQDGRDERAEQDALDNLISMNMGTNWIGMNMGAPRPMTPAEAAQRARDLADAGVTGTAEAPRSRTERAKPYSGAIMAAFAGGIAYAFTGKTGLSVAIGLISGAVTEITRRDPRKMFASMVGRALPPSTSENCVDLAKQAAVAQGLDLATLPAVPPVSCSTRSDGKSECKSADGTVQAVDCLPEPGSAYLRFALAVERALALRNLNRAGNGPLPAVPVGPQPIDAGRPLGPRGRGGMDEMAGYEWTPMVFASRDGRTG